MKEPVFARFSAIVPTTSLHADGRDVASGTCRARYGGGRVTIAATRRSGRRRPRRPRDSLALFPQSPSSPENISRRQTHALDLSLLAPHVPSRRTFRVSRNLTPYGLLFSPTTGITLSHGGCLTSAALRSCA